ncbi:2-succinylbenzoyl-CoA synthetase [Mesobacillus persicus]|uniref:2-succinylbenzoate--CoA ligase n=1 Tax=Mesobacillus persicus TaxID=930146 RepID=A0A1H7Y6V0_9BACI|nr:o-succinylbenzoate--CoA ligase [Mesobacillus persicus]SEM40909.1 2-succinylbenzoyl-CoA synthetase [Mesobacillus persicus]
MKQLVPNFLKKRADLTPDRVALIFEETNYTFRQLFEYSREIAGQLCSIGLKKESTAGVLLSNHKDSVMILYALQMLGVRAVILNNRLTSEELLWQLEDSEVDVLLYENAFANKITEIKKTFPRAVIEKEELFQLEVAEAFIENEFDLDDVTTIMYTSGTTGHPKGVLQTFGNHWWSATASALNIGLSDEDRWLCAVPIFHISGYSILMKSVIYGMTVVLHQTFNEKAAIEDILKYRVTTMSVVSTMLLRINERLEVNQLPGHFRCMLLGGGPAPLSLLEDCKEKGIPVYQSYGMTETASQFATLAPEYSLSKLGSAGKALFPNQIKIIGKNGEEVSNHSEGEIVVKGPNVTIGYLNRVLETSESIKNGWFHTGDIGYLDAEGFLYVLDRRSDLIISGGENIYPAEIEGVLMSHPDIADAGVIGFTDSKWGQVPGAFIVAKGNTNLSEGELIEFCTKLLAKYKVPKVFRFVEELPRNASKKLLRKNLREMVKKEHS